MLIILELEECWDGNEGGIKEGGGGGGGGSEKETIVD
jgi:hypothetical protein